MRFNLGFEAEPFQGYTEFDEFEFSDMGEFEEEGGTTNTPKRPQWVARLLPALNRSRGDIPLEFLLGWIAVESDGQLGVVTRQMDERGYFQISPEESKTIKVDHKRLSTDSDYSVQSGIKLVRYYMQVAKNFGYPPGTELFWRVVKLAHAGIGSAKRILDDMRKHNSTPQTWDDVRSYVTTNRNRLLKERVVGVDPLRLVGNVDHLFEQARQLMPQPSGGMTPELDPEILAIQGGRPALNFEAEQFSVYNEFDETGEFESENSDEWSGEVWRRGPRTISRRPRTRVQRRPRRPPPRRRRPGVFPGIIRFPVAGFNPFPALQNTFVAAPDGADAEPLPGDGDDSNAAPPPDASAGGMDAGGADMEPSADQPADQSADQSEFEEWEWLSPETSEEFEESFEWTDEVSRSSAEYVRWVQQSLNQLMGARLAVDGISGPLTRSAVTSFQQRYGLLVDGIVGPQTEGALIRAGAQPPPGFSTPPSSPPSYGGTGFQFVQIPGIEKTSQAFRDKVVAIARDIGTDPNYLMAIMSFESGISPTAVNQDTQATGLIQFMPSTARRLGTTTDALARMTGEQQLDYVALYFAPYKGRLRTLEDAYMAVLYPSAIGKGSAHALFSSPSDAYRFNSVLDLNRDGQITVAEATSFVRKKLPANYSPGGGTGNAPSSGVNTQLPVSGTGFRTYEPSERQYGLSKTIEALMAIARTWQQAHPNGPRIDIGDISRRGGGYFSPHSTHQKGVDVDIHPMRNDGQEGPVTFRDRQYSRQLTQELVNTIRANRALRVRTILFNDSQVSGVEPYKGHDNHLHVSFNAT